jgi:hypothetical protein
LGNLRYEKPGLGRQGGFAVPGEARNLTTAALMQAQA